MDELQEQWARDREKKGRAKKERAAARRLEERRAGGKASKKGRRQNKNADVPLGSATDLRGINARIRDFLLNRPDLDSLSLPPMTKRDRVGVHLLAEAYSLKSKSMGSGKGRFPVLIRTARSAVYGVNERHIEKIIGSAAGEIVPRGGGRGRLGGLWDALGGEDRAKTSSARRTARDGAVVGQGAGQLDENNLGFRLLRQMGYVGLVCCAPLPC
jgi:hypothetical protein